MTLSSERRCNYLDELSGEITWMFDSACWFVCNWAMIDSSCANWLRLELLDSFRVSVDRVLQRVESRPERPRLRVNEAIDRRTDLFDDPFIGVGEEGLDALGIASERGLKP